MLDRWYPQLKVGQMINLTGQRVDPNGEMASEVMQLKEVLLQRAPDRVLGQNRLSIAMCKKLGDNQRKRSLSTHGESRKGSAGQWRCIGIVSGIHSRQPPLTYVVKSSSPKRN